MKSIKGHSRVRGFIKDDNKERYKIHKDLKKNGISYNPRKRMIFNSEENDFTKPLIERFGYVIENQLEI